MIRVLNLSGMSTHSISQIYALNYIEKKYGISVLSFFDLIIGQSSGAFLAAYLTKPHKKNKDEETTSLDYNHLIKLFNQWHDNVFSKTKQNLNITEREVLYQYCIKNFANDFLDIKFDDLILPIIIPTNQLDRSGLKACAWSTLSITPNNYTYYLKDILPGTIALNTLYDPHKLTSRDSISYHYDDANLGFSFLLHALTFFMQATGLNPHELRILSLANTFLPFIRSPYKGQISQHYKGINDLLLRDSISHAITKILFPNYLRIDLSKGNKDSSFHQVLKLRAFKDYINFYSNYLNDDFFQNKGLDGFIRKSLKEKKSLIKYQTNLDNNMRENNDIPFMLEDKFQLLTKR